MEQTLYVTPVISFIMIDVEGLLCQSLTEKLDEKPGMWY